MFSLQSWFSKRAESKASNHEEPDALAAGRMRRFGAMPKLVDQYEFAELRRQPGFDDRLLRKLRTERRRAYRLYLSELVLEFRSIERKARDRAANDSAVHQDFAEAVFKAKLRFETSVFILRLSTWLPDVTLPETHRRTVDLLEAIRAASRAGTAEPLAS